ncbi:MAG: hypothetical protein HW421_2946 [Ignavibacteria bacterium]|nr:hypothetical protein [Ignavibacteria bacterium]
MQISTDTEEVLNFLDFASQGNLRKRADLGCILEVGARTGNPDLINKLIHHGSSIYNISTILRRDKLSDDEIINFEKEIENQFQTFFDLLVQISQESEDEAVRDRFEKIYLNDSSGARSNAIDLSFDLTILKDVQTQMRKMNKKEE